MGEHVAPVDLVWFDAVEIEVIAGTVRFALMRIERDADGETRRRVVMRAIATQETTMQGIVDAVAALTRAGCARARHIAGYMQ
jgi:hypothetical protein